MVTDLEMATYTTDITWFLHEEREMVVGDMQLQTAL